jgi:hypothetical protein
MAARLGEVLYWACNAIGAVLLIAAVTVALWVDNDPPTLRWVLMAFLAGPALLSVLFGRACLYVLSGR